MRKTLLIVLFAVGAAGTAHAQNYVAPRTADGHPDLQGVWKAQTRAGYNLLDHDARHGMPAGFSVVEGGAIPYQPWAAERQKENFANRATLDPLGKCFRPGVPRINYIDFPFQIFQTARNVVILYEWTQLYRVIPIDGSAHWDGIEFWMGDSRGRWEGDTLVVDVINHNAETWFDMAGNFHSEALKVVERYTRVGPDTIRYEATIEDPKVFTRPWKMSMSLGRDPAGRLLEYQCQAEAEEARGEFVPGPNWYGQPPPASGYRPRPYAASLPPRTSVAVTPSVPRRGDGRPNLDGIFNGTGMSGSWGLEDHPPKPGFPGGESILVDPPDQKLPMQEWTRAEQQKRLLDQFAHQDPTARCFVAGVPRSMYVLGGPMQIIHTPDYVLMLFERWSYRIIATDGRPHLPDHVRLWMGDSVGRWEGDTLVVETTNSNGKSWLNEIGEVITHTAKVVERFTMVDQNRIEYEATVDDPLGYTRPWTIAVAFNRSRGDGQLMEQACHEGNEAVRLMQGAAEKARQQEQQQQQGR
jgi:hypothetical protein